MDSIGKEIQTASHWQPDLEYEVAGFLFRDKKAFKLRLKNLVEIGSRDMKLWSRIASRHNMSVAWHTKHESTSLVFEEKSRSIPIYLLPLLLFLGRQALKFL